MNPVSRDLLAALNARAVKLLPSWALPDDGA